jgi:hypothetical protein
MCGLSKYIQQLENWLEPDVAKRVWERVLIGEESELYQNGKLVLSKNLLHIVSDYEAKFLDVMTAGNTWVNLSALGLLGSSLVICVEIPKSSAGINLERVSVNFSGSFKNDLHYPSEKTLYQNIRK